MPNLANPLIPLTDSDLNRFWEKVNKAGPIYKGSPCWQWTASSDTSGYGQFKYQRRNVRAHRVSWYLLHGNPPLELQVNHLCSNPLCVNPSHLEVVTCHENINHGRTGDPNRNKTHCPYGHPYDEQNTYWHGPTKNKRHCRQCLKERQRRYYQEGRPFTKKPRKR